MNSPIELDVMERWLLSGSPVRICGFDLWPMPHPCLPGTPQCVVKGQASVYFLRQHAHGTTWLLKTFHPGRRPSDEYLAAVSHCLPSGAEFFTCSQRRVISREHIDLRASQHKDSDLADWLLGTILMLKVPGAAWASWADDLRDGQVTWPLEHRLRVAQNLVKVIARLERAGVAHRDLSATNVFVGDDARVYLIDFDCLYHARLPWQSNTTAGTLGYIAPFIRTAGGQWDGSRSWRPRADRFSLAILIAEFLLVDEHVKAPQEDGTLFAQVQLNQPDNEFVRQQVDRLADYSRECASLVREALQAKGYDSCPSPEDWSATLAKSLAWHRRTLSPHPVQWVACNCTQCGAQTTILADRLSTLKDQGKPLLCKSCLANLRQQWAASQVERDKQYPEAVCERCSRTCRIPSARLDELRSKGRPILCPPCLTEQLAVWRTEKAQRDAVSPLTQCSSCSRQTRIRREKLDQLRAAGKAVLCRSCLEHELSKPRPLKRLVKSLIGW